MPPRSRKVASRRPATLADFKAKTAKTSSSVVKLTTDEGDLEVEVKAKSLSFKAYDALLGEHPPTDEQKKKNASYNVDTFAPALLAACLVEPTLTDEEAAELWVSPEWSKGELSDLFLFCVDLNQSGLNVPFNETD